MLSSAEGVGYIMAVRWAAGAHQGQEVERVRHDDRLPEGQQQGGDERRRDEVVQVDAVRLRAAAVAAEGTVAAVAYGCVDLAHGGCGRGSAPGTRRGQG